MELIYCIKCGHENLANSNYCSNCGNKTFAKKPLIYGIVANDSFQSSKEKIVNIEEKLVTPQMTHDEKKNARNGCILLIVIILAIVYFYSIKSEDKTSIPSTPTELGDSHLIMSVEQYLENNYLRDPNSYESIEWRKTVNEGDVRLKYQIYNRFRAKNGFGGYAIEEKIFFLDKNGNVESMMDVNDLNEVSKQLNMIIK